MLELINLCKTYTNTQGTKGSENIEAIRDINIEVEEGRFVSIVGLSGCGKTTILRIVAGLEMPSSGKVSLDGAQIREPGVRVGLVFQEYALLPWRSVLKNVEFGLEIKGIPRGERRSMAMEFIKVVELEGFENRYPKELSGGMMQRVAIVRTLINEPRVLLMDEPFGSLDSQTRNSMQEFLLNVREKTGATILFVTHNIDEAVFLSDKVVVLSERPGTVKKVFDVDLKYPRERTSVLFNMMRREIGECIKRDG